MSKYDKYINALRKCAREHENDRTSTGHIIVSDLCRDTANLLEEIEYKSKPDVLDKIRAEIEEHAKINYGLNTDRAKALCWCLNVIDKYKEGDGE